MFYYRHIFPGRWPCLTGLALRGEKEDDNLLYPIFSKVLLHSQEYVFKTKDDLTLTKRHRARYTSAWRHCVTRHYVGRYRVVLWKRSLMGTTIVRHARDPSRDIYVPTLLLKTLRCPLAPDRFYAIYALLQFERATPQRQIAATSRGDLFALCHRALQSANTQNQYS